MSTNKSKQKEFIGLPVKVTPTGQTAETEPDFRVDTERSLKTQKSYREQADEVE